MGASIEILTFMGVLISIISLFLSYIWKLRKLQKNDIRHLHERIDNVVKELSELKERVARLEARVDDLASRLN